MRVCTSVLLWTYADGVQRNCLFTDELEDIFNLDYRRSNCIVHCRAESMKALCGCVPFNVPNRDAGNTPICTLEHIECLNQYKGRFYGFSAHSLCLCVVFVQQSYKYMFVQCIGEHRIMLNGQKAEFWTQAQHTKLNRYIQYTLYISGYMYKSVWVGGREMMPRVTRPLGCARITLLKWIRYWRLCIHTVYLYETIQYQIAGKWSTVVFSRTHIKGLEHETQDGLYCIECLPCCLDTQYSVSLSDLPLTLSMKNNSNLLWVEKVSVCSFRTFITRTGGWAVGVCVRPDGCK